MSDLKEYIVTLKDKEDLDQFYDDMETPGGDLYIPNRAVNVADRRPTSRNTIYLLSKEEADLLRNDSRVSDVELVPKDRGISPGLFGTQTSPYWDKSSSIGSQMKNWGLLRCVEGAQRSMWGSTGTTTQSATINLTSSGKNVDVVICDENGIVWNHPEYAINADGTGGTRTIQYNWYQHDPVVKGIPASSYSYSVGDHSSHVAGTVAGNTQGWARSANIYNIYYLAGDGSDYNFPYVIDYIREFHKNKPINPATGRKNPTIVNNSWGMSIFPAQWSFSDITAVTYRGTRYVPSGGTTYTGSSGVYSSNQLAASLIGLENAGNRITSSGATAQVTSISATLLGAASLASSTTPPVGSNDDGYWQLTLPFNITFLGTSYSTVCVGTNMYITFGDGSTAYSGLGPTVPALPKILVCADDRSTQRIFYGIEGASPNRTYRIRVEGHASYSGGVLGSPTMVMEYTFYENTPAQIDLVIGTNSAKTSVASFTTAQLNAWGFIAGQRIPQRVAALDADIEDALAEGIIMVGAAGNGKWKHDVPGGPDWNNTFEMNGSFPGEVFYYMRGTSPTANDNKALGGDFNINNICVGSIDVTSTETKASYSDCGPGVDLYAPGTEIISALTSGVIDPRSSFYFLEKYSGTSMATPQVTGVLACALEAYPDMNQDQAKEYILHYAKRNQIVEGNAGPTDTTDLQGSPNLYLYYYKERPENGVVYPKKNYKPRPSTGQVYPRPRIKR